MSDYEEEDGEEEYLGVGGEGGLNRLYLNLEAHGHRNTLIYAHQILISLV